MPTPDHTPPDPHTDPTWVIATALTRFASSEEGTAALLARRADSHERHAHADTTSTTELRRKAQRHAQAASLARALAGGADVLARLQRIDRLPDLTPYLVEVGTVTDHTGKNDPGHRCVALTKLQTHPIGHGWGATPTEALAALSDNLLASSASTTVTVQGVAVSTSPDLHQRHVADVIARRDREAQGR